MQIRNGLRSPEAGMRELTLPAPGAGGLVLEELEEKLSAEQTSELDNLWFRGDVLARRPGQTALFETGKSGVGCLLRTPYRGEILYTADGGLYAYTEGGAERLCTLTGAEEGCMFLANGRVYFLNGTEYLVYDGLSACPVEPYLPTVERGRAPDGSTTSPAESFNRIGRRYRVLFSPPDDLLLAGAPRPTVYLLPRGGLSDTALTVRVEGTALAEGTGYTVNRESGVLTFASAPAAGENTVEVIAETEDTAPADNFLSCTLAAVFGGENETRIFFAGNGTSTYFWSEKLDPSYIPEENFRVLGDNSDSVTALGEQYGRLILFKAGETWSMEYDPNGADPFPVTAVNRAVGCDAPGSVALVANRLVWLHSHYGVCTLLSTGVTGEKNVQAISRNIEGNARRPGLLAEDGLAEATACVWQGYYLLSAGEHIYLWDWRRTPFVYSSDTRRAAGSLAWYRWSGVRPSAFCLAGDELCYFRGGTLCRFYERYIDFGEPFTSRIRLPLRDFGLPDRRKSVMYAAVSVRGDVNSSFDASYVTEREAGGTPAEREVAAVSFDLAHWDLTDFSLDAVNFLKTVWLRPHRRRVLLFGMEFSCSHPDREMNICSVSYHYRTLGRVR